MSQNERILEHLEAGNTITPREAFDLYGTLALHSRIAELRSHGARIDMRMESAGKRRWGVYYLAIPHG